MKLLLDIYFKAFWSLLFRPPHFRVFWNYLKYLICRIKKNDYVTHTPTNIVIYTTINCNLSCDFCFIGDDLNPKDGHKSELTLEQFKKMMATDFFKNSLRVGLLGGEPFLARDIFDIIKLLKRKRKISTIVTNSTLLKRKKLQMLKECPPDILGLSLYEINKDDVKRVYLAMVPHTIVWIQTIIEATELSKIEESIKFCLSIGCKSLRFSNYYPTYGNGINKVIFDDNQEFKNLKLFLENKYLFQINISWPAPIARKIQSKNCLQPFSYTHISNTGAIGACFMRSPDEEKYGNIFNRDDWNKKDHLKLRNYMNSEGPKCDPWCRYCENLTSDLYKV